MLLELSLNLSVLATCPLKSRQRVFQSLLHVPRTALQQGRLKTVADLLGFEFVALPSPVLGGRLPGRDPLAVLGDRGLDVVKLPADLFGRTKATQDKGKTFALVFAASRCVMESQFQVGTDFAHNLTSFFG